MLVCYQFKVPLLIVVVDVLYIAHCQTVLMDGRRGPASEFSHTQGRGEMAASRLRVVLGIMEMGRRQLVQDEPCFAIIDKFLSRGHAEIDTALMYTEGKSEAILGRYTSQRRPDKVVVATKANPWEGKTLSAASVADQLNSSLTRLQTSCVDIFYLHAPDHTTPLEDTLKGVNTLHKEGKFKEFGLSNYASWEVADVWHICKSNNWVLPTVYQGMYNAVTRMVEGELFPCLRQFGLRFYAYNPLAGGILSGRYSYTDKGNLPEGRFASIGNWSNTYIDRFWRQSVFEGLRLIREALDESYGVDRVSLVSAAFRWLNHHSLMTPEAGDCILVGGSRLEHVTANLEACEEGPLDPRVVKAFDEAWQLDRSNCALYYR